MRLTYRLIAALSAAALSTAAVPTADPPHEVTKLADEYFAEWLRTFPVSATFNGVTEAPPDRVEDLSPASIRAWEKKEDAWLRRLHQVPAGALRGHPEDATYGVLLETLEASVQLRVCRQQLWMLNQQSGWHLFLPVLAQVQPLGTPELRHAALTRWHLAPRYIDQEIANLRQGLREGYSQPRGNAEAVLDQLNQILAMPAEQSPFAGLAARDSAPGFRDSVVAIVAREILPAATRYRDFVRTEYIPRARTRTELTALPKGADCYRARVRQYTTAEFDARAVHRLGLEQMAAIEKEARPLAQKTLGSSDLPAVYERMRSDTSLTFHSRDEIIRTAKEALARAKAAMPKYFGRLPRGDVIVA
ncbi:MAG TPA: DUF885 family protein, partial [Gemmatimonadales bacterium]